MAQQGDVLLFQGNDGGDILVEGGLLAMTGGLETAAYLSLFGGNEDDDGQAGNPRQWWGNLLETEADRQYRGEFAYLLATLPPITSNLRRLEDAAERGLAWFVTSGVASEISATATMPAPGSVRLVVSINADRTIEFIETWRADA